MKKEKKRELLREIPHFVDDAQLEGDIDVIVKYIKSLPQRAREAYPDSVDIKNSHRFSIRIGKEYNYGDSYNVYHLQCWRWETDEDLELRLEQTKKEREAAKKAAITRKTAQEKRERSLLETLKKKYE
jgi:hypothetical protein